MPSPSSRSNRSWLLAAAAVIGVLGFSVGAIVNQGVGRLLKIPDDAVLPEYTDVEAPVKSSSGDDVVTARVNHGDDGPHGMSGKQYSEIIVRRNIFDSSAVYNPEVAKAMGSDECKDSPVKLLATVVAEPAEYSSALISETAKGAARGYAIGDELGGEGHISRIEQKRVCLDGGGCICMDAEATAPKSESVATGAPTDSDGKVEQLAEGKYRVDPSFMEEQMKSVESLATQVRVVPHKGEDGSIDGYRLSAIRHGSLFDKLGIKNGDIVHSVNGQALTSAEGALTTYQTLQSERAFNFEITRRNQKQTLEYEVR